MQVTVTRAAARARGVTSLVASLALILSACSASVSDRTPTVAATPAPRSIAEAGRGGWETAPSAQERAYRSTTIRAPSTPAVVPVRYEATRAPTYTTSEPASLAYDVPPPPPPPTVRDLSVSDVQAPSGATAPAPTYVGPSTSIAAPCDPCPPAVAPVQRQLSGCNLACTEGVSQWHLRGLVGFATYAGTDAARDCDYWGLDLGRTFCGCWGLDVFYRWNGCQFDRMTATGTARDGGEFHHIGIKFDYESQFGQGSRFYWWAGIGPEYFTTTNLDDNDSGFGVYGEVGIGYLISSSFRIRAGVALHGLDTDAGREDPLDDGKSRWLWIIAPHIGVEFNF